MSGDADLFRGTRFASREREEAFRRAGLRADVRITGIAYSIMAVNLALFGITDRVLFGTGPAFWALLALRVFGVLVTVALLVAAARASSPARVDALHLALAVFYAAMTVVLDSTRPRTFVLFIGPETGLVFASWVFFSARFAYQAIAAGLFTAGVAITFAFSRDPLTAPGYLAVTLALINPHIIGVISSRRLQRSRRLEWLRAEELAAARRAAEEANRSKSLFLGMVSHEVLAPLGGIVASVEALQVGTAGQPDAAALGTIHGDAAALRDLLGDVLDLARGEAVAMEVSHRPASPAEIVGEVERALSGLARAKGLRLDCATAPDVPARLALDPRRVRQVLLNLAANALRCTERGAVTVRCGARPAADGVVALAFQVSDTGPGIPAAELASLFEPWWQSTAGKGGHGRAGLGLSVARLLAQRMGGSLEVESRLGEGSRFTLTLPRVEVSVGAPPGPAAPRAPLDPSLAAEAGELARVPHAGRALALAERVEAHARRHGDVDLARWAEGLRAAADRLDVAELTALLARLPGR